MRCEIRLLRQFNVAKEWNQRGNFQRSKREELLVDGNYRQLSRKAMCDTDQTGKIWTSKFEWKVNHKDRHFFSFRSINLPTDRLTDFLQQWWQPCLHMNIVFIFWFTNWFDHWSTKDWSENRNRHHTWILFFFSISLKATSLGPEAIVEYFNKNTSPQANIYTPVNYPGWISSNQDRSSLLR